MLGTVARWPEEVATCTSLSVSFIFNDGPFVRTQANKRILFSISNYDVYRPQTIWIKEIEMHFYIFYFLRVLRPLTLTQRLQNTLLHTLVQCMSRIYDHIVFTCRRSNAAHRQNVCLILQLIRMRH